MVGQDPDLVHRLEEKERRRQQAIARNREDSAPIVAELTEAGFPVEWISDLYNKPQNYENAIPVLLRWLPVVSNPDIKMSIVRSLSVRWAKPVAAAALIGEYRKLDDSSAFHLKWAIGNALSVVADDSVFEDVAALVRDRRHGRAREMLALALANMKDPRAVDVLIELLGDEEVAGHALSALRKLKAKKARSRIEQFLDHPKAWIRKEARRALSKIDGSK